jgi:hypothetical protein
LTSWGFLKEFTGEVVKYIDGGAMPRSIFLQPGSKYLWVSSEGSVSAIDTDNNVLEGLARQEDMEIQGHGIDYSNASNEVYQTIFQKFSTLIKYLTIQFSRIVSHNS